MDTENMRLVLGARKSLLLYFGALVASCTALQIVIAIRNSQVDIVAGVLLAFIAIYYAYVQYTTRAALGRIRYGRLVSHLIAYLVVNLSFHVHASILFIADSSAIRGQEGLAIEGGWFGVLIPMTTFWGFGLLLHTIGSVISRGFEEVS